MSTVAPCKIPGNSDIAGIGVRVAVYLQAFIVVVDTWLKCKHFDDPKHSKLFEDQSLERSLLITALAIVVSALIEVTSSAGLTDYHALVVLNLSLLNFWAGFNLLRAVHESNKSKAESRQNSIQPRGNTEESAELNPQNSLYEEKTEEPSGLPSEDGTADSTELSQIAASNSVGPWICEIALPWLKTWLLFYAHSAAFSALGLVFWINPGRARFLGYTEDVATNPEPCQPSVVYWAFRRVDLTNSSLKYASIIFYAVAAIPVLNGLAIKALSLTTVTILWMISRILLSIIIPIINIRPVNTPRSEKNEKPYDPKVIHEWVDKQLFHWIWVGTRASPLVYILPVIYWIVATEMLIRSNSVHLEDTVEGEWNYGQIMALFTALGSGVVYILHVIARTRLGTGLITRLSTRHRKKNTQV